ADPQLLDLRGEVALLEARELELLKQLGQQKQPPWGKVAQALGDYKKAKDKDKALAALEQVVRQGADAARAQQATWNQLYDLIDRKSRTVAAESKRLHELSQYVTVEQAVFVLNGVLGAVRQHVTDRETLEAVQGSVARWLDGQPRTVAARERPIPSQV